jgi:hypothetical protein
MGRENLIRPATCPAPGGSFLMSRCVFAQDAWISNKANSKPFDDLYSGVDPGWCGQEDSAS